MIEPYFSVCIPQYGRTDFLLKALESLSIQSFRDFEICISDDNSQDGRQSEIIAALRLAGFKYDFYAQAKNRRYDANLRTAISLARGKYCLLLGNDDALVDGGALARMHEAIETYGPCGALICDFQDYLTGARSNRLHATGNKGFGPKTAASHFRNFSFVSGVILERISAQNFATDRWDGSEMYQTFIGCRIIASGKSLIEIAEPLIRKDIYLPNLQVDSYASRPRAPRWPIVERIIPLVQLGRLTADAVSPYTSGIEQRRQNEHILRQLLIFTYPFWLFEYRRVQSWSYAFGVGLAMRPRRIAEGIEFTRRGSVVIRLYYLAASTLGLVMPTWFFDVARPYLYRVAKSV
jgi:glycosyltransferase involved in cell wall biosynthesis